MEWNWLALVNEIFFSADHTPTHSQISQIECDLLPNVLSEWFHDSICTHIRESRFQTPST